MSSQAVTDTREIRAHSPSASVVQVESSKLMPLLILLSVLSGCALALSVFAMHEANIAEREARLAAYYVEGVQRTLAVNGMPNPGDDYSWHKPKVAKQ